VRALHVLALVPILFRASVGRADEVALPLDLTWSAPAACASAEEIRAELGRIARVRPGRTIARIAAYGRIDKLGQSYRLTLRTQRHGRQTGERSLVAQECRSLEREVTLVLALAFGQGVEIDESKASTGKGAGSGSAAGSDTKGQAAGSGKGAGSEAQGQAAGSDKARPEAATPKPLAADEGERDAASPLRPEAASAEASPSEDEEEPENTESSSESTPPEMRAGVLLGAGVQFGMLPSAAPLVVAGGELGWKSFWFEPRIVWLPPVSDALERGVQARYDGFGGALAACVGVVRFSLSSIGACLGADAIALRGRSSGASERGEAVAPLLGGALTLAWEWPASGVWGLRLEAQLHVAFNEPRFVVDGLGEAHRVPRFGPSVALTLALWPER
jgi:hypothetical protein